MIFLEIICFEFPCVAGSHFPKIGGSFSQTRWLIFPKSVVHFPKSVADLWFSQTRGLISPKSVADFPKVGSSFCTEVVCLSRTGSKAGEPEKRYQTLKPSQTREKKYRHTPNSTSSVLFNCCLVQLFDRSLQFERLSSSISK